ncbi:MAG: tyrosine-protein phosphatase [Planctomycetota bacterium]
MARLGRRAFATPLRAGLSALVLLLLFAGGRYAQWSTLGYRFATISPGRLYQSAQMPPAALVETAQEYDIATVVDLRERQESAAEIDAEAQALEAAGVRYVHLPISYVPEDRHIDAFLGVMQEHGDRPMLVHCEHGEGRSVMLAAVYRMEAEGQPPSEAMARTVRLPDEMTWLRYLLPTLRRFGWDSEKGRFVRSYQLRGVADETASRTTEQPQKN